MSDKFLIEVTLEYRSKGGYPSETDDPQESIELLEIPDDFQLNDIIDDKGTIDVSIWRQYFNDLEIVTDWDEKRVISAKIIDNPDYKRNLKNEVKDWLSIITIQDVESDSDLD